MPARSARPKLPPDLARPLARIRRDLAKLDAALTDHDEAGTLTFDQAATVYRELDQALRDDGSCGVTQLGVMVRDHARTSTRWLMPSDNTDVPGVGTLAFCNVGGSTEWDGLALVGALAARVADHAVDQGSGEIKPPGVIAEEAAMVVADCAGLGNASASFKTTAVKLYGLDPDRYREKHGGTLSVRFT